MDNNIYKYKYILLPILPKKLSFFFIVKKTFPIKPRIYEATGKACLHEENESTRTKNKKI